MTTSEVARLLRLNQKKVYALVAEHRIPSVRVSGKWLFPRALIDRWLAESTTHPESGLMSALLDRLLVMQGSDDWLLGRAIDRIRGRLGLPVVTASVGSLDGIRAVGAGAAHMAGFHVEDEAVKTLVPRGEGWYAVSLATREQGLMVPRGGPRGGPLAGIADVVERGLTLADRQPGSGTARLTRRLLGEAGVDAGRLVTAGPFATHVEAAAAVRGGSADVAVGIRVAAEVAGLDFLPLVVESFKIAVPGAFLGHRNVDWFLDSLLGELDEAARAGAAPGYAFPAVGATRPLVHAPLDSRGHREEREP